MKGWTFFLAAVFSVGLCQASPLMPPPPLGSLPGENTVGPTNDKRLARLPPGIIPTRPLQPEERQWTGGSTDGDTGSENADNAVALAPV